MHTLFKYLKKSLKLEIRLIVTNNSNFSTKFAAQDVDRGWQEAERRAVWVLHHQALRHVEVLQPREQASLRDHWEVMDQVRALQGTLFDFDF